MHWYPFSLLRVIICTDHQCSTVVLPLWHIIQVYPTILAQKFMNASEMVCHSPYILHTFKQTLIVRCSAVLSLETGLEELNECMAGATRLLGISVKSAYISSLITMRFVTVCILNFVFTWVISWHNFCRHISIDPGVCAADGLLEDLIHLWAGIWEPEELSGWPSACLEVAAVTGQWAIFFTVQHGQLPCNAPCVNQRFATELNNRKCFVGASGKAILFGEHGVIGNALDYVMRGLSSWQVLGSYGNVCQFSMLWVRFWEERWLDGMWTICLGMLRCQYYWVGHMLTI